MRRPLRADAIWHERIILSNLFLVLLGMILLLSSFLDTIAAALIGGVVAAILMSAIGANV